MEERKKLGVNAFSLGVAAEPEHVLARLLTDALTLSETLRTFGQPPSTTPRACACWNLRPSVAAAVAL